MLYKNLKYSLILLMFLSFNQNAQVQRDWVNLYTGLTQASIDKALNLVSDGSGKIFVTGVSGGDYATIAYTSNGGYLWQYPYAVRYHSSYGSSQANWISVQKPGFGRIYVTGYSDYIQGSYYKKISTIAYNSSDGSHAWPQPYIATYSSPYGDCEGNMVTSDIEGNVYVVGYGNVTGSGDSWVILKYDQYGNPSSTWPDNGYGQGVRIYSGPAGLGDRAVSLDLYGESVYVAGYSRFTYFDERMVIIAYSENGSILWGPYDYGISTGYAHIYKKIVAVDYNGVYVTGTAGGSLVIAKYNTFTGEQNWLRGYNNGGANIGSYIGFYSKAIGRTWAHTNDIFVAGAINSTLGLIKYDEGGNLQNPVISRSGAEAKSMDIDANENVFVCTGDAGGNMLTLKYNSKLGQVWPDLLFRGSGNGSDAANSIVADPGGNIVYVTGQSLGSNTNYDYTSIKYEYFPPGGNPFLNPSNNQNESLKMPSVYSLSQNYPNPFNPITRIKYAIPKDGFVSIKIYNTLGQEIAIIVNEHREKGYYSFNFDAHMLPSGIYFYRIESNDFTDMKKMVLIK